MREFAPGARRPASSEVHVVAGLAWLAGGMAMLAAINWDHHSRDLHSDDWFAGLRGARQY